MKKSILQKSITMLLTSALSMQITGCGDTAQNMNEIISKSEVSQEVSSDDTIHENTSGMGRYIEKVTDMSETMIAYTNVILNQDNKTPMLYSYGGQCFSTSDNGTTWEEVSIPKFKDMASKAYISSFDIAADGTMAISYVLNSESDDNFNPQNMFITAEGEEKNIIMDISEDELYIRNFDFDDTGRLFASVFGPNIYEIDRERGESSLFLTSNAGSIDYIRIQDNKLMCAAYDSVFIYDMDSKEIIEDEVMADFIKENCLFNNMGIGYESFVFWGNEENIIYIACDKGLYRHVLGGSAFEQIIDGKLSTLGNPSYYIKDAMEVSDNEFIVVFSEGRIVHYVYDENIPTVPNDKLSVYSLKENDSLKQAIMAYQTANPDMYVEYEVGIDGNGITRDDALKNFNTKLMDGSGPDVMILDEMPVDSYIEKGVLMDISDTINQINDTDGLYMNLIEPFYENESLYAVPSEFKLPVLAGDKDVISKADDYESIAAMFENLRNESPQGSIIYPCSASGIMKYFKMICEPSWKNAAGSINEENVREFLIQSKRIYDAQLKGITQNDIEHYNKRNDENIQYEGVSIEDSKYFSMPNSINYLIGNSKIICGDMGNVYTATDLFSMARTEGHENTDVCIMNGQSRDVYISVNLLGINASTPNKENAISFVKTILGTECQNNLVDNFPVNSKAFENTLVGNPDLIAEDGAFNYWASSDELGNSIEGVSYWFTEEQKELLRGWIAQADTPFVPDILMESAVFGEGEKYLKGEQDIDTSVKNIMNSAVYMME